MLLDLFFPRRCLGCGAWGNYFCRDCQQEIKTIKLQICPICQKPALQGQTHPVCQTPYSLDGLTSIFTFEGVIKEAIGKLKYWLITDLIEELVALSVDQMPRKLTRSLILVPIPLHPRRQRWRGFNQAELLAKILGKQFNWQISTDYLIRSKATQPQIKLKSKERKINVQKAFKLNPKARAKVRNKKLIVFDDVWTTGSTLRQAAQVLKRAQAQEVWGLTLAR
ncbi:MAG TPA: ComF family protein [Patescibacteria group bacterium]|nr:ComF family protein [Patescibacteria group bacterium]